jgi:hypothetical protein
MKVGVIGYGYWGPNIVRNLLSHPDVSVAVVADQRKQRLLALKKTHPSIATVSDAKDVITAKGIDGIAIATPVNTHYSLVRAALAAGKHVLVEKPLAASLHEAESLVAYAQKKKSRADGADFTTNNLHVLQYSTPIDALIPLTELRPHLHTLPDTSDWIFLSDLVLRRKLGFCLTHRQLSSLTDGLYRVVIDSDLKPATLAMASC